MTAPYSGDLIALAQHVRPMPPNPTHSATVRNRYCADVLTVGVCVVDGQIDGVGWEADACVVCRASANRVVTALTGRSTQEIGPLLRCLNQSLQGEEGGPFHGFHQFHDAPSRHACARLPLVAVQQALAGVETARSMKNDAAAPAQDAWQAIASFRERGLAVALATLVDVVGSSPCPVGSHVVVASNGEFWGAVSGGCVESAVVQAGLALLDGHRAAGVDSYRIANSQAGAIGLPCGGQVRIHLGFAPGDGLLRQYQARGRGFARVLQVDSGAERLAATEYTRPHLSGARFIEPLIARPRLVLVGGTRIAQVLASLAETVGFETIVVEPRLGFAGPNRFACEVRLTTPEQVLPTLIRPDTAVVMLTHDARMDDPGIAAALQSEAFYVGALGSRKTQRVRLERLRAQGLEEHALSRLRGPAGLALGAVGAQEIALSILAEIVAARRECEPVGVGVVVLAGGRSVRAGASNKLLQDVGGTSMIRRVVDTVTTANVGPCVVVLGHDAARVREVLGDAPVQFVDNERFAQGMGTSVAAGIEAIAAHGVDAAMVVLGDMPFVESESLVRIAQAHTRATNHLVVVPVAGEGEERRRANPVLWPSRYFASLMALTGDQGGKAIVARAPGAVLELPLDDPGVLRDVDIILPNE